jgi:hypothetical protein
MFYYCVQRQIRVYITAMECLCWSWIVTPSGLTGGYQRLRATYSLQFQFFSIEIQMNKIDVFTAVKTSNLT